MEKLSIVIPALNEEHRLPETLKKLSQYVDTDLQHFDNEILIVVPNGTDKTLEVAKNHRELFNCEYLIVEPGNKLGKGRDVQAGILKSSGDKVIFMDADLATPLHHIPEMINNINSNTEVCIGIRDIDWIHDSKLRAIVSRLGNIASKLLVGVYYEDTQCGFKGFTRNAVDKIFTKQTIMGWAFDIEILAIAQRNGLEVSEILIKDWIDVPEGNLTDNVLISSLNTLKELFKIRLNILLNKY
jgi:dolichyl-phosphate beta-glucosyltransferase